MKYYELTKEQIKAIRIIKGYNPDLRIGLKYSCYEQKKDIMNLIEENTVHLLGVNAEIEMQRLTDRQREKIYNNLVMQVYRGGEDR